MRLPITFLLLLSTALTGLAQDTFRWADYRARYDRRVQMTAGLDYQASELLSHGVALPFRWLLARNLDHRQFDFSLSSSIGLSKSAQADKATFYTYVTPHLTERRYRDGAFFRGSNVTVNFSRSQSARYQLKLRPHLLLGWGRLEQADDALLAHWMTEELPLSTIGSTAAEVTEKLAHTITELIGNRTFDQRRRRIYELEQLAQHLDLSQADTKEQLFAYSVLNDNWAFANRRSIQHGWEAKLEAGFYYSKDSGQSVLWNDIRYFEGDMGMVYATIFPEAKLNLRASWLLSLAVPNRNNTIFGPTFRVLPRHDGLLELYYFPNSRHFLSTAVRWTSITEWKGQNWEDLYAASRSYTTQVSARWNLLLAYNWQLSVSSGWVKQSNFYEARPILEEKNHSMYLSLGTTYLFQ